MKRKLKLMEDDLETTERRLEIAQEKSDMFEKQLDDTQRYYCNNNDGFYFNFFHVVCVEK